ncbi:MAG: nitroreductase family protein [Gallionella sp.]|nr:nitroreductase family protein [Gallionella sp.]
MSDPRVATVLSYHTRSKHALDRYAAGPGTLDWEAQPKAFRDWQGAAQIVLPREVTVSCITWDALTSPRAPLPLNIQNLGSLLRLCVGLTAWKEYSGSRWSLRAHPSSGNLHPTETWLIAAKVDGLENGLYHYQNQHHYLERRAWGNDAQATGVWLGFSSIHWREAWKYGERAFRYCQLDMGHVLAAVSYAAALHGWKSRLLSMDAATTARCLGLERIADFEGVEAEEAEVILMLEADANGVPCSWEEWAGKPSLLDARPLYQWPIIEEIAVATRGAVPVSPIQPPAATRLQDENDISAAQVILKRRSAQAFDGVSVMPRAVFKRILSSLLPGGSPAWDLWTTAARVHPVLLVHRVEGVAPGVYVLPRNGATHESLRAAFRETFIWQAADSELPLYQLIAARAGKTARTLSCHQDIATQCAVTFMMVAEFAQPIAADPVAYRHLHWEAGMLGHVITLEAEAAGWRGTGIGCFFDDAVHEVLGIKDDSFQVIYHYAVGMALDDPRISTLPAYE